MNRTFLFVILIPLLLMLFSGQAIAAQDDIQVFCWDLTPQAQVVVHGLERVLGQTLPVVDAKGKYENGDILLTQLARQQPRLLIVLGTQALALTAPQVKKGLVIFAMVADPYHTGAAYNKDYPDDHQENITGIASPPPLAAAIARAVKLFPAKRHWGLVYDPSEGPSVELKQNFADLAQTAGLTLTVLPARSSPEATAAFETLKKKGVQVVFMPPDSFSAQYARRLLTLGLERRFVVVNGNPRIPGRGAVLRVTLNYAAVGEEAGRLARRVLDGEKTKTIPIRQASPAEVEVDEALLTAWAGYPPGRK